MTLLMALALSPIFLIFSAMVVFAVRFYFMLFILDKDPLAFINKGKE